MAIPFNIPSNKSSENCQNQNQNSQNVNQNAGTENQPTANVSDPSVVLNQQVPNNANNPPQIVPLDNEALVQAFYEAIHRFENGKQIKKCFFCARLNKK
jgi:hypothetical protein